MTTPWSFSYHSFVKLHGKINMGATHMTLLYPNMCYNEVHYKGTVLYLLFFLVRPYSSLLSSLEIGFRCMKLQNPPRVHSLKQHKICV